MPSRFLRIFIFGFGCDRFLVGEVHLRCLVFLRDLTEEPDRKGNAGQGRQNIRHRLGGLDADEAKKPRQDEQCGNVVDAAAERGRKGGLPAPADALEEHVGHDAEGLHDDRDALETEGQCADPHHVRVIPEDPDHRARDQHAQDSQYAKHQFAGTPGKKESLADPAVFFCPVIVGGNGLEALADAHHGGGQEHDDPGDDRHGRDGRVPVGIGADVQGGRGNAVQDLPDEAREAVLQDGGKVRPVPGELPKRDAADGLSREDHVQKDAQTDILGERGRKSGAVDPHMKAEHQDRIADHVQDAAGHQTEHGVEGPALIPEDVVQYAGDGQRRPRNKDIKAVMDGVGQDRLRAPQKPHQGRDEDESQDGGDQADQQGGKKAQRSDPAGGLLVAHAQMPADVAAGALAEHKAQCLEYGLDTDKDTDGGAGAGAEAPDKIGVDQVVDHGDQHAEYGRKGQPRDQLVDGSQYKALILRTFFRVHEGSAQFCSGKKGQRDTLIKDSIPLFSQKKKAPKRSFL